MSANVLITGCSTGIGYATAELLHQQGYTVFATARKETDIHALKAAGLNALYLDLHDSQSITDCVNDVNAKTNNCIDILINNAAYGQVGALEDISREALLTQFETNVFGTHELTIAVLQGMKQRGAGKIISISSILGLVAMPYRGAYNASKYALEGLMDTLRLECKKDNIDIVLIEPGPIVSNFRKTAIKSFETHVDIAHSRHQQRYETMRSSAKDDSKLPFALPASAVAKKALTAIRSKRPKAHYYVTLPTHILAFCKRILPTRWLDKIVAST